MSSVSSVTDSVTQALISKALDAKDLNQNGKVSAEEEAVYDSRHSSAQASTSEGAKRVEETGATSQSKSTGTVVDVTA